MRRNLSLTIFLLFAGVLSAGAVSSTGAGMATFQSGPDQTVLIELFTSEGCSSCPPADAWMTGLKNSPYLWKAFVPVAFHVDYWDYLGWKDALSSAEYTRRQREYSAVWKTSSVYTPMMVENGKESREWYRSPTLSIKGKKDVGVLRVEQKGPMEFEVSFLPHNGVVIDNISVHAAYLGCGMLTRVGGGENQGKILPHDFTALSLEHKKMQYREGVLKTSIQFNSQGLAKAPRHAIAVWISKSENDQPLQSTGGFLD